MNDPAKWLKIQKQLEENHRAYRKNARHPDSGKASKLERLDGDDPLATAQAEKANPGRVRIRVTSVRSRLLDFDNLAEKYHVDCCRYAGLIPGDSPEEIDDEPTTQRKRRKGEEEHTEITITYPRAAIAWLPNKTHEHAHTWRLDGRDQRFAT